MSGLAETAISKSIVSTYHDKLLDRMVNDVLIGGAGSSGLTAVLYPARKGLKVTMLERRPSPGADVWGGGMAMGQTVVQDGILPLLDELSVGQESWHGQLYVLHAIELAARLCLKGAQSGAVLFNLMTADDVCIHRERVAGVVVNRSLSGESFPADASPPHPTRAVPIPHQWVSSSAECPSCRDPRSAYR